MMYLKLEDKTVLKFDIREGIYEIKRPELLPFALRGALTDSTELVRAGGSYRELMENERILYGFFFNRSISVRRENAKLIMNELGIAQGNNLESRYDAMVRCHAISVADSYWITENEDEKWKDVRLENGALDEALQQIALFKTSPSILKRERIIRTPELTGQGAYAKAWYLEDGKFYLYKDGSEGGDESRREVLASDVLDCFNIPHVKYTLAEKGGKILCRCENMNFGNTSIVDSLEFDSWTARKGLDFYGEVKKIDAEMYYKTIVADYLIGNVDRHSGNWGFYMNNSTGSLVCMHPLFDHNKSFDRENMKTEDGGNCQLMPGKTQKEAALYALERCDFRCIKPVTKNMFYNMTIYSSFMKRAVNLGLYREQKLSLFDKVFDKSKEAFVPVELKADNTNIYWEKARKALSAKTDAGRTAEKAVSSPGKPKRTPKKSRDADYGYGR